MPKRPMIFLLPFISLFATSAQWNVDADGDWDVNGNWNPASYPNGIDEVATFDFPITANRVVSIDSALAQSITVSTINFDANNNYTIQSGFGTNNLIIDATSSSGSVNITSGTGAHSITCPILMNKDFIITNNTVGNFTLAGVITGGKNLVNFGSGTLTISGSSSNDTIVIGASGTTILDKDDNITAATTLFANGGYVLFNGVNQLPSNGIVQILNGGTFDMTNQPQAISSLSYWAPATLTQGTATLSLQTIYMREGVAVTGNILFVGPPTILADPPTVTAPSISGNIDFAGSQGTFSFGRGTVLTSDMIVSGVITNGSLSKQGTGILELTGSSPNTSFNATSILTSGELILNKDDTVVALPGSITIYGGTLQLGLGKTGQIATSASVNLDDLFTGSVFDLNGNDITLSSFTYSAGTFNQGSNTMTLTNSGPALTMRDVTISGPLVFTGGSSASIVFATVLPGTGVISGSVDLGASNKTFNVSDGGAATDLSVTGVVSGNGGVIKSGLGLMEFAGGSANTYLGTTTVSGGTLLLNKTGSAKSILGNISLAGGTLKLNTAGQIATTSNMTIDAGGAFDLNGINQTLASLTYNAGTLTTNGATLSLSSASSPLTMKNTTITGNIALTDAGNNATVTFDATSGAPAIINGNVDLGGSQKIFNINDTALSTEMVINGQISNGSFRKSGAGLLQFSGTTSNDYLGMTTVTAGVLQISKTGSGTVGIAGDVTISGGQLVIASANRIAATSNMTISGGLFSMPNLAQTLNSLTFTSGGLTQNSGASFGTLTLTASSGTLTMAATSIQGPLVFTSLTPDIVFSNAAGTGSITNTINLGGGTAKFTISNAGGTGVLAGVISNGSLYKTGLGTLQMAGGSSNLYGSTRIDQGTMLLGKTGVAIPGDLTIEGTGTVRYTVNNQIADTSTVSLTSATATYDLNGRSDTIGSFTYQAGTFSQGGATLTLGSSGTALTMRDTTISGPITISNGGKVVFDPTNAGTAQISGGLNLVSSSVTFDVPGTGSPDMRVNSVITSLSAGSAGITKISGGALELSGAAANTYTGLTTVSAGTLSLFKDSAGTNAIPADVNVSGTGTLLLSRSEQIADSSTMTISSSTATFDMGNFSETISRLNFYAGTLSQLSGVLSLANSSTALVMYDTTINGSVAITGGGKVVFDKTNLGTASIAGPLDLGGSEISFDIQNGSAVDMNISGVISGSGSVKKINSGALQFSGGSANTYAGTTTVNAGQLILSKTAGVNAIPGNVSITGGTLTLAENNEIANTASMTISSGAFDMAGKSDTITDLTLTGGSVSGTGSTLTLTSAGAALTMQNSTTFAANLSLTGNGGVAFTGASGMATISGNINMNTFTTEFAISDGTSSPDMDITGVISSGALTKSGAGYLRLSGSSPNTYLGETLVSGGDLLLKKTAGVNAVAGDVRINGGRLKICANNQIADTATVTIDSGSFVLNSYLESFATLVFNGGSFTTSGGTLTLTDPTTALTITNRTLPASLVLAGGDVVFDATNNGTATLSGPINLGGVTSEFNISNGTATIDMEVSGVISNGSLTKTGAGTLLLSGANNYAGGTLVSAGTLQGDTISLQGDITNNANLVFDHLSSGSYIDNISGPGSLVKRGSGRLNLTSSNSCGSVTLSAGTLAVNGTLSGGGTLMASPGTILQGTGVITKNCNIAGTLAPGNSIGTLTLVGDQTLLTGSTFEVELNTTMIDLLNITGTITIESGSTLYIIPEPGNYSSGFSRVIINTTGGRSGTFSTVTTSLPLFTPVVVYTANTVLLEANQNTFLPFTSVADKGNAGAVAKCLDSLVNQPCSNLSTVILRLRGLTTTEEIYKVLLELQPSSFTALAIAQENDTLYVKNTLFSRLEKGLHTCCGNQGKNEPTLWVAGLDGHTSQRRHGDEMGFIANSPGAFIGYDMPVSHAFIVGVGAGYTQSHLHWRASRNTANIQSGYGAAYMHWMGAKGYIESALMGTYNHYSTKRFIEFGNFEPIDVCARGQHGGAEGSVHMKLGMKYGCEGLVISPFAAIDYLYLYESGFKERGAQSLNLTIDRKSSDLLSSEGGLDFSYCLHSAKGTYTPYLKLSAIRESRFFGQTENAAFLCGCHFDVKGYYPSRTLGAVGVGLNAELFRSTFSLFYQGKFGSGYNDNEISLNYQFAF